MTQPLVLLDCDGLLAGFVEATLAVAHQVSSKRWEVEDLHGWDFWKSMSDPDVPDLEARIMAKVSEEGFCSSIPVLPGAVEGVESLRSIAEVVVVTSPWKSPTWAHERFLWLERNFGFGRQSVIQTPNKEHVDGDVLVDDSIENLRKWDSRRMRRGGLHFAPVLWSTHFNRSETAFRVRVARDWDDVVQVVKVIT